MRPASIRRPTLRRRVGCTPSILVTTSVPTATPRTHGLEIIGVVHSHTHTEAYPSPTDVAQAPDPSWHYVIVSLRTGRGVAALVPDRRRCRLGGAGPHRRRLESRSVGSAFVGRDVPEPTEGPLYGRVRLGARPDRQHADGRRQPRSAPTPTCGSSAKLEGQNPGGSVKDRIALSMIERGRGRRHPAPRADASSSRRRATPASPWP